MSEPRATAAAVLAGAAFAAPWWIGFPLVWTLVGATAAGAAVTGRPRADVLRGFLLGCVAYGGALAWLPAALGRFGVPPVTWGGLVLAQATIPALAFGWSGLALSRGVRAPAAAGLAWVAAATIAEWTQPLPHGPELALASVPALLGPVAIGGTGLLAGVLFAWGAVAARAPAQAALWAAAWGAGFVLLLPAADASRGPTTRVGLVEPAIGALEGRRPSAAPHIADRVRALAGRAAAEDPDWIATSEGAWPWDPGVRGSASRRHLAEAWPLDVPVVLGAISSQPPANTLLVLRGGDVTDRFDKQRLVPLAEQRIAGLGFDTFIAGTGPRTLDVGIPVTPLICYEDLLAGPLREASGVALLAAAHDAWHGPVGARQHLAGARLAAVGTGRWLVRATGSGWSGVVDPAGRILWTRPFVDADARPSGGRFAVLVVPLRAPWFTGVRAGPLWSVLAAAFLLARVRRP